MNEHIFPSGTGLADLLERSPNARHEALVDLFGQYVIWARNRTQLSCRQLVESKEARDAIGALARGPYEAIASLSEADQQKAISFAASNLDYFIRLLLSLLAHRGFDFPFGDDHAVRLRLIMEIADRSSGDITHEETINRDGEKHFADYWGRWLNRVAGA